MNLRLSSFLVPVSVVCGILLFFIFRLFTPLDSGTPESAARDGRYAVLVFDESADDRLIQNILARNGMESFISESSQYVPMDDFGTLKMLPLDSFHDEIAEFDPRDSGYAAKLRSFFVHDGKRFFFCPVDDIEDTAGKKTAALEKKLTPVFGGIPFSCAVLGREKSVLPYFVFLVLGSAFTLYLARSRRRFLYQVPPFLALGWAGPFAVILAALLAGIWELLREPLCELFAGSRYEKRVFDYAGAGFTGVRERLKPFRLNLFLAMLFLACFFALSAAGHVPPVPLAAACACFFFLYFLSLRSEQERARSNRHVLFVPVLLFPLKSKTFSLFPFLAPFTILSALVLFLPQVSSASGGDVPFEGTPFAGRINGAGAVTSGDYYRHLAFQRSFSYMPLNYTPGELMSGEARDSQAAHAPPLNQKGYLRYYLGDDGLIAGGLQDEGRASILPSAESPSVTLSAGSPRAAYESVAAIPAAELPAESVSTADFPPFPLEKLMEFLLNYDKVAAGKPPAAGAKLANWIVVGIVLAVCVADLFRSGVSRRKKIPVFGNRRIAA